MFGPDFYPTPIEVAVKMLANVKKDGLDNILEPSAGKGDLAEVLRGSAHYGQKEVDCIEINPELAAILRDKHFPVVGEDFLNYNGVSYYDAIVMNPPFSAGDEHLLKAWEFLYSGEIVCLLNAETVKNPHTKTRQLLAEIIRQHGEVEYLGKCFDKAQRPCPVEVAMVHLKKVGEDDRTDLWATDTEEKKVDSDIGDQAEDSMLALIDKLGNMEHFYNMANEHMHKAFAHVRKAAIYMTALGSAGSGYGKHEKDYGAILHTAFDNVNHAKAEFGRKHRRAAWMQVLKKMEFHKWLDKKQQEQFYRDVETNANIPFTADNIKGTLENIFKDRNRLFQQSCANVFDELTRYHYGNTSHREGWKTNDSFRVNPKVIFPYGCEFDSKYFQRFGLSYNGPIDVYNDLDRVLCVLDGKQFTDSKHEYKVVTIGEALRHTFERLGHNVRSPFVNTCTSQFFDIRFFKKGTIHLKWKDRRLWEAFNIAASAGKRWLGEDTRKGWNEQPVPDKPEEWAGMTWDAKPKLEEGKESLFQMEEA